ncbi:hypothetical protein [Vulcanisaeta sp. JCM 16159]|uniref:hypothetical protein n=1 Tax=Vulcanisaeta sp. JCM 16159 TaxID=1295371 RepID=UPI0006CF4861|nr:hypothetical protein [Vulcanisaeta sp. JCM 16159]
MYIDGVSLNDGDASIKWHLMANDHRGVFEGKVEAAKRASELGDDDFMVFLLFAVLGDGDISVR